MDEFTEAPVRRESKGIPWDSDDVINGDAVFLSDASEKLEWTLHTELRTSQTYGGPLTVTDVKRDLRRCCSLNAWRRRLPISVWITRYSLQDLKGDMIAGITVGLTVIPQALAYSQIAELPLEYGLYSAFMGCFMYTLFGTSKDVTLGPTAIISLLIAESFPKGAGKFKPQYAIFLSFFTGIFQFLMGALNLGFVINFISTPVISGFTTASAFIIMFGQFKSVLGVSFGKSTDGIVEQTQGYVENLWRVNGWDILMGVVCIAVLLVMKELRLPLRRKQTANASYWNYLREGLRLISVARYGIVVILATVVGFLLEVYRPGGHALTLTRNVTAGLPPFQLPDFSFDNSTGRELTFPEIFEEMSTGIIVVSLVGAMESIAIAKAFAHQFHYSISPTQEFLALGVANFMSSFVSSYPVTGSFTKSALNAQSGVRTPMGCVFTGIFVLTSLSVLSASFRYVPKAALGAIIICAVSVMFEFKIFRDLWLLKKKELLPLCATIFAALFFGVDYGILAGIAISLILLMFPLARPEIDVEKSDIVYTLAPQAPSTGKRILEINVTPRGALYFPSAEYLKEFFEEDIVKRGRIVNDTDDSRKDLAQAVNPILVPEKIDFLKVEEVVVFNGIHLMDSDYTTLRGLRSIVNICRKAGRTLKFINTPAAVLKIILPKDLREQIKSAANGEKDMITVQFSQSLPERLASVSVDEVDDEARKGSIITIRGNGAFSMGK